MLILYICLFLVFLFLQGTKFSRKTKCIVVATFLFIFSAMKSLETGDLSQYILHYQELMSHSFFSIIVGEGFEGIRDVAFYGVARLFSLIGLSAEIWIMSIALLFAVSVSLFIYRESYNFWISTLLVVVLYFRFSMTGLRQTVALSIILFSYEYIKQQNLARFICIVVVAALFHSSAFVFLPAYFIAQMKYGKKQLVILVIAMLVLTLNSGLLRSVLDIFVWQEGYTGYSMSTVALSWNGFFVQLFLWGIAFIMRKNCFENEAIEIDRLINIMLVGVIFQAAATQIAIMFRLGYYYNIFSIALLPRIIYSDRLKTNTVILSRTVVVLFLIYMHANGLFEDFQFFWN